MVYLQQEQEAPGHRLHLSVLGQKLEQNVQQLLNNIQRQHKQSLLKLRRLESADCSAHEVERRVCIVGKHERRKLVVPGSHRVEVELDGLHQSLGPSLCLGVTPAR